MQPSASSRDSFVWRTTVSDDFSVKDCYRYLFSKLSGPAVNAEKVRASLNIWKIKAPSNFLFFGWRIIHGKIGTKDQLYKRKILNRGDLSCVSFVWWKMNPWSIYWGIVG